MLFLYFLIIKAHAYSPLNYQVVGNPASLYLNPMNTATSFCQLPQNSVFSAYGPSLINPQLLMVNTSGFSQCKAKDNIAYIKPEGIRRTNLKPTTPTRERSFSLKEEGRICKGDCKPSVLDKLSNFTSQLMQKIKDIMLPVDTKHGRLTSDFGLRVDPHDDEIVKFHAGIDIAPLPRGTNPPVYAVTSGKVIQVVNYCEDGDPSCGGGYGNFVLVKQSDGTFARYSHLQKQCGNLSLKSGQEIKAGQEIGCMGNTGKSTNIHLDLRFSTRANCRGNDDCWINPNEIFGENLSPYRDNQGNSRLAIHLRQKGIYVVYSY